MTLQRVLAIETSCDDTSVAIVTKDAMVEGVVSANQDLQHQPFGGVVPEIACRNHTLQVLPLVEACFAKANRNWSDIDGLAVTSRPGLIGSLLVGVVTAKSLALAQDLPFVGVNHLEGHLLAPFLKDASYGPPDGFAFPYIGLAVSGGHTHLFCVEGLGRYKVLGHTIDDAAGEAFDKFAKMMGLGFPGGVQVDRLAKQGHAKAFEFPRPLIKEENLNFSFSGLKTAAQRQLEGMSIDDIRERTTDLCASYQQAIVDVLIEKIKRAVKQTGIQRVAITGGVSANSQLRETALAWGQQTGVIMAIPPLRYCTDNAAMIGLAGIQRLNRGERDQQDLSPSPRAYAHDFIDPLAV